MKPYPYQDNDIKQINEAWTKYQSVLYQLPTGGGKTVVINEIIESILDKKILILVHRREIIFQIRDRLKKRGITAGVLIGGFEENIDSDILIGSIRTVARDTRLEDIIKRNFDYMIIDEAHHACSSTYIKTITDFKLNNPNYKLLGVTATPYRKDKKKLSDIFDVLIQGPTYSKLREGGYLADYKCYAAKLEGLEQVDLAGGDFKLSDLSKYMRSDWLIEKAIHMYKEKGENKQMLVFCVDKKHAIQVEEEYNKAGYTRTAIIDSDTLSTEREKINKDYRNGNLDIIISIQTLTEGVDLPETGVVQLLRPTLSIVLYLQILGRGTRKKKDGSHLIILDLSNNSYEHGLLDSEYTWNLNNDEPNPKKSLNKIVGKRGKRIVIDQEEIEKEFLEIEEMSHDDFLLQQENGIQLAEDENKNIKDTIRKKMRDLCKILNEKCKIPNSNFKTDINDYFSEWNTVKVSNGEVECKVQFDVNKKEPIDFSYSGYYLSNKSFDDYILMGEFAKFFKKKTVFNLLLDTWREVYKLNASLNNINVLKQKINEGEEEKCIFKIDQLIKNGNYKFKLEKKLGSYSHNFRDVWRPFDTIIFVEEPKKLKVNNKVEFYNGDDYVGNHSSAKKEILIDLLQRHWYKKE